MNRTKVAVAALNQTPFDWDGNRSNILRAIDTAKAAVARRALAAGASMINDISALRHDSEMTRVAAESGVPVILMHMLGTPQTMQ